METATKSETMLATGKNQGLDIEKIRGEFPMLKRKLRGMPLIYFDSAATGQKPNVVIDTLQRLYKYEYAKPQEQHTVSKMMTEMVEETRKKTANFINAASPNEIIFTSGTTESINIIANSFAKGILGKDDEVIITALEHHANIIPWQIACEASGAKLRVVAVSNDGEVDIRGMERRIGERTKIIAITHSSHVLGAIQPVREICRLAHERGIAVLVDAAQSAPHMAINVTEMDCDFLVFSGHKMGGPAGVGVLYGKAEWLRQLPPHAGGSENAKKVTFEKTEYQPIPKKFEPGSGAFEEIVAFGALLDFVEQLDIEKTAEYEIELLEYATKKLSEIDRVRMYGRANEKEPVLSFALERRDDVSDIEKYLSDKHNIDVRSGALSAQPLMKLLGVKGLVRISFCYYNTREEIDYFAGALQKFVEGDR
jgi:cysteine desulfurase/selenocysteine lyase